MNPVSHQQLAMFMTAKEIKGAVNQSSDPHLTMEHLWDYKLDEAKTGAIRNSRYKPTRKRKGASFYESIQREGVKKPVEMTHITKEHASKYFPEGSALIEGHHRVAAAHDINPNMLIPVTHDFHGEPAWRKPKAKE